MTKAKLMYVYCRSPEASGSVNGFMEHGWLMGFTEWIPTENPIH